MPDDIHRPPGDGRTSTQGAAVLAAVDHLPLTARWLARRAVDTPNATTRRRPPQLGLAVASPDGAPGPTHPTQGRRSNTGRGELGGRAAHGPAPTPSTTSEAADVAAPTASTPTQIDPTKEY